MFVLVMLASCCVGGRCSSLQIVMSRRRVLSNLLLRCRVLSVMTTILQVCIIAAVRRSGRLCSSAKTLVLNQISV